MTCPHQYSDGAYVLGALSPAERAEFEQHLTECDTCAGAVRQLAPLPGLLGRVDPAAAEGGAPSSVRLPRLVEAAGRLRRRHTRAHRLRLAAATASAAVAAAVGAGVVATLPADEPVTVRSSAPAATEEMRAVTAWAPVTARVGLAAGPGGTTVTLTCQYDDADYQGPAHTFRLVAVGTDGTSEQIASWQASPGDEIALSGLTRFSDAALARVELRYADGSRVLVHEP